MSSTPTNDHRMWGSKCTCGGAPELRANMDRLYCARSGAWIGTWDGATFSARS